MCQVGSLTLTRPVLQVSETSASKTSCSSISSTAIMAPLTRNYARQHGISLPSLPPSTPLRRRPTRSPSHSTITLLCLNIDVFVHILSWTPLDGLYALMQVCRPLHVAVLAYLSTRFELLLKVDFLLSPDVVRTIMRANGYIINGHTCTQFIINAPIGMSGLNFIAYRDRLAPLIEHLYAQGYRRVPSTLPWTDAPHHVGLTKIATFSRKHDKNDQIIRVNIKTVHPRFDLHRILAFPTTTASLSYLTADAIHIIYPQLLFSNVALIYPHAGHGLDLRHLSTIVTAQLPSYLGRHIRKLDRNGFDVRTFSVGWPEGVPCGFACPALQRRQDPKAMTFSLVFDSQAAKPYEANHRNGDLAVAGHVRLMLSGRCYNQACPHVNSALEG